jgi:hypothetical protein
MRTMQVREASSFRLVHTFGHNRKGLSDAFSALEQAFSCRQV